MISQNLNKILKIIDKQNFKILKLRQILNINKDSELVADSELKN